MLTTYTPYEYLMIDIANQYGEDKELYSTRMDWVDARHANLEDFTDEADKPELYLAAVLALRAVERGEETGHLVGLDAAASGPQIMAALTGCFITAQNTGLIGKKRGDIYSLNTSVMSRIMGAEVDIARDDVKDAFMPMCYGSQAKPKEVYGEGTEEYNTFFKAVDEVAPVLLELLESLVHTWKPFTLAHDWYMADGYYCYCPVMIPKDSKIKIQELDKEMSITYRHEINCGTETGVANAANSIHSCDALVVREMGRRCNYTPFYMQLALDDINIALLMNTGTAKGDMRIEELWRESGFMSLVGIVHVTSVEEACKYSTDYLEALKVLIERTLTRDYFPILFIHDEFKCHANHVQTMRQTYVEIMAELADSEVLSHILSQISGDIIRVEKLSTDLSTHILQGEYSIC